MGPVTGLLTHLARRQQPLTAFAVVCRELGSWADAATAGRSDCERVGALHAGAGLCAGTSDGGQV